VFEAHPLANVTELTVSISGEQTLRG